MGKKSFRICAGILAVALGIMVYLNFGLEKQTEYEWIGTIEMANRNVTWSGAGYSGIYKK